MTIEAYDNVHIHLLDSDSWLEPGETLITEVAEMSFVVVKLKWSDYGGISRSKK